MIFFQPRYIGKRISWLLIVSRLFKHDCFRADNHRYVPLYKRHNKSQIDLHGLHSPEDDQSILIETSSYNLQFFSEVITTHIERFSHGVTTSCLYFTCIVCMYYWSSSLICFSVPKAEKTVLILFPWSFWLDSQWRICLIAIYFLNRDLPISR